MKRERRRTLRTEEVVAAVERTVQENSNLSIHNRAQQLKLCALTLWKT